MYSIKTPYVLRQNLLVQTSLSQERDNSKDKKDNWKIKLLDLSQSESPRPEPEPKQRLFIYLNKNGDKMEITGLKKKKNLKCFIPILWSKEILDKELDRTSKI